VASLYLYNGPDQEVVRQDAIAAVNAYVAANHRPGRDIVLSALYAALHRAGVQRAVITSPSADLVIAPTQAAYCTAVTVTIAGRAE
jgi:phage-related baseplate assembly protein